MDRHRIDLEDYDPEEYPGGYVEIKASRTLGDQKRLESSAAKRITTTQAEAKKGDEGERWSAVDFEEISAVLLETSIVAWSLEQDIGRAAFKAFDVDFGEWLEDEIEGYYTARREEAAERRKARAGRSQSSTGESATSDSAGLPASPPSPASSITP